MHFRPTALPGVVIVETVVHADPRGRFFESYHARKFLDGGIDAAFVQDNRSQSKYGTLRGLHSQRRTPQGKLVSALTGRIFDVAVDVRRGSPAFGRWLGVELSADNNLQLYVPPGFLHGFCVLSESAEVLYKCTDFYDPGDELGVIWNDPDIAIRWPIAEPILSPKDGALPSLQSVTDRLPRYDRAPS